MQKRVWELRLDTTDVGRLWLGASSGTLRIRTDGDDAAVAAGSVISVSVDRAVLADAKPVTTRREGDFAECRFALQSRVDGTVVVRPGTTVVLGAVDADLDLKGEFGVVDARTVNGTVRVRARTTVASLLVDTLYGSLRVHPTAELGGVRVTTFSGTVEVADHHRAQLQMESTGGKVRAYGQKKETFRTPTTPTATPKRRRLN